MKKIAIIGAGGFGREVKFLIDQINAVNPTFKIIGFFDDEPKESLINGVKYLGNIEDLNTLDYELCLAIAIGDPKTKLEIIKKLKNDNLSFPNLIHPSVIVNYDTLEIGLGNIICAGNILTVNITLHHFIILNLCCTVGHDTIIESYSSLMPSVNISGEVIIREGVYVGTGTKIINQLEIGCFTVVGAGALVSKSLPERCTAVGIPAKPIKFHS